MSDCLPFPQGDFDNPTPTDAPSPELVDLVSALTMLGARLPLLITLLDQLRAAIPQHARDALLGKLTPVGWAAMAALCQEPGRILLDLATLCQRQARDAPEIFD